MKYLPYKEAASVPNIIVDGAGTENTVMTLSHWPKSGTPSDLKADTSAEIVFKYLESPYFPAKADVVSNNHFDEDGLVGIFSLLNPELAQKHRELLIDVARAGDFGVYKSIEAARIVFTISAYSEAETSPLAKKIFSMEYPEQCAELYFSLIELMPLMIANIDDYRTFWEDEDKRLNYSERFIEKRQITFEEYPDLDLTIIRIPEGLPKCHPFALNTHAAHTRLIIVNAGRIEFQYRYESWVQVVSRKLPLRIDLSGLANQLNQEEGSGGKWIFEGVNNITPRLYLKDNLVSTISSEKIIQEIMQHLKENPPAWDPFD